MRLGAEVIAVDRDANAPAMQVAHRSHVLSCWTGDALRALIQEERPSLIVPEIEAIATQVLVELKLKAQYCTNGARRIPDHEPGRHTQACRRRKSRLPTFAYRFASDQRKLRGRGHGQLACRAL